MEASLLLFSLSLAIALQLSLGQDESCTRLDGKTGYCVPIRQCLENTSMWKRRRLGYAYTEDELTYIKNSACPGNTAHMCCEDDAKVAEGVQMLRNQNCGQFRTAKTIGGKEVELMSRPWMVYLTTSNKANSHFMCGGTLIHKRYVLTAAHCLNGRTIHSMRFGEHNQRTEEDCKPKRGRMICAPPVVHIEGSEVFTHEAFSSATRAHDIALVKLSQDVTFSRSVKPICLPLDDTLQELTRTLEKFLVAGWGYTGPNQPSDVLTETLVSNMNATACDRSYRGIPPLTSSQLCAGDIGHDSCNGDSGGPLTYVTNQYNGAQRFVQFGITSFGSPQCGDQRPGVYTNVGSYMRWIAYKIATK